MDRLQLVILLLGLTFAWMVFKAMQHRRLAEREGLPWLGLSLLLICSIFLRRPLDQLAAWMGVAYAPALWLLIGLVGLVAICFRLAVMVSALHGRVVRLTQELALLQKEESLREPLPGPYH